MSELPQEHIDLVFSLKAMRRGLLLAILGSLLLIVSIETIANPVMAVAFLGTVLRNFVALVLALAGVALFLVGFYFMFVPGVTELKESDPDYATPAVLIEYGYMFGLILLIFGILFAWSAFGQLMQVLSFLLLIIGTIGMIILCFKLYSNEESNLYVIAGFLLIVGVFIGVAMLASYILMYLALGKTIRRYSTSKTTRLGTT